MNGWRRRLLGGLRGGRLHRLENTSVFNLSEVVKYLGLLAQGGVGGDGGTGNRNCSTGAQVLGENKPQQSILQAQERDLGVLHVKHLGQDHAGVHWRHSLAQYGSQGEEVFRKSHL